MTLINLAPGQQGQMQNCVNDAAAQFNAAAALVALAGPAPAIHLRWRVRREGTNDLALFVSATGINDDYQYLISPYGGPVPARTHNSPTAVPPNQWVAWTGAIPAAVTVP